MFRDIIQTCGILCLTYFIGQFIYTLIFIIGPIVTAAIICLVKSRQHEAEHNKTEINMGMNERQLLKHINRKVTTEDIANYIT